MSAATTLCGILLTSLSSMALAQTTPPAGAGAAMARRQKVAETLGITDAQKAQMKSITDKAMAKDKEIQDSKLAPDAKKLKIEELRKSTRKQIMAVLTPEQLAKIKAMKQNAAAK